MNTRVATGCWISYKETPAGNKKCTSVYLEEWKARKIASIDISAGDKAGAQFVPFGLIPPRFVDGDSPPSATGKGDPHSLEEMEYASRILLNIMDEWKNKDDRRYAAIRDARIALKHRMPLKVLLIMGNHKCPNCYSTLTNPGAKYCDQCGHRIIW